MKVLNKLTIIIVIIGLLASIPLIIERFNWESSSNQVEIVLDYDDISMLFSNDKLTIEEERDYFEKLNGSVTSIGISETTLERLKIRGDLEGDIWVYSGKELLMPFKKDYLNQQINPKHTYVLFKTEELKNTWEPLFNQFLSPEGEIRDFSIDGYVGFEITAPYRHIKNLPLGIDPVLAKKIQDYGFNIVPRISNAYSDKERNIAQINDVAQYNPTNIIFQGTEVTGYPNHLKDVAAILNEKQIGIGIVEMSKEQDGLRSLSYHLAHYNEQDGRDNNWYISRVHSLSEFTMNKKVNPTTEELEGTQPAYFSDLQEQVELSVTERNIRIIYMHAPMTYDTHVALQGIDQVTIKNDSEEILTKTILAAQNIADRLEKEGFTIGEVGHFEYIEKDWMSIARWLTLLGGIAVIGIMLSYFYQPLKLLTLGLGVLGIIIAKLLGLESLYFKFIGLGTAVSIPVIAINYAANVSKNSLDKKVSFGQILRVYFTTSLISFSLAMLVVGMFSHIKYSLYLDQFRGVSVLYLAPLLLTTLLLMLKYDEPIKKWLTSSFKNYYLIILGALGILVLYYLSRSGNEATVSALELKLRNMLQTNLDIRPRTKEFLFGYPLLALGIYLSYYYKRAAYILIAATMGQLSIVSTFTHLHTPFSVSVIRTGIGMILGLIIGLILILTWKILQPWLIKLIRRLSL